MSDLLRESIKRNYFRAVKQLLVKNFSVSNPEEYEWDEKEKKNINRQLKGSESILSLAIHQKDENILNLLLLVPCIDVNQPNYSDNNTPLIIAIKEKKTKMVEILVACSDVNMPKVPTEKPKYITQKAEPAWKEYSGDTPLIVAVKIMDLEIVNLLLNCERIDVNLKGNDKTALFLAIETGQDFLVKLLLATQKININDIIDNMTVLILACRKGMLGIVKMLLEYPDININYVTTDGHTALNDALTQNYNDIVSLLWDTPGINVNIKNKSHFSPLLTALYKSPNMASMMLKNKSLPLKAQNNKPFSQLVMSTLLCNSALETKLPNFVMMKIFNFFISRPALDYTIPHGLGMLTLRGSTALSLAAQQNNLTLVKNILYEKHIIYSKEIKDNVEISVPLTIFNPTLTKIDALAIFYAVKNNNADILKILLYDEKSDPRNINFDNITLEMRDGRLYLYNKNSDGSNTEYYIQYEPMTDFNSTDVLTFEDIANEKIKQIIKDFKRNLLRYNAQTKQ